MNGDFEVATISLGKDYFDQADKGSLSSMELLELSDLDSDGSQPLYKMLILYLQ